VTIKAHRSAQNRQWHLDVRHSVAKFDCTFRWRASGNVMKIEIVNRLREMAIVPPLTWLPSNRRGIMSARFTASLGFAFARNLHRRLPHSLAGSLLSILRSRTSALWHQTMPRLVTNEQHIGHIGRLMLIGYSSLAIVLTVGVIADNMWRHPPRVGPAAQTATNLKADTKTPEAHRADAARTAYGVSMDR
jgi:hypothetical protein